MNSLYESKLGDAVVFVLGQLSSLAHTVMYLSFAYLALKLAGAV